MKYQRTSVGLDVHALSVAACALDGETGELIDGRLTPADEDIWAWLQTLPGPIKVTYEVGPTGYGLARFLRARGIACLARLLKLGEIVEVTVPSVEQESARDLVRAREDCRGDLMHDRHRFPRRAARCVVIKSNTSDVVTSLTGLLTMRKKTRRAPKPQLVTQLRDTPLAAQSTSPLLAPTTWLATITRLGNHAGETARWTVPGMDQQSGNKQVTQNIDSKLKCFDGNSLVGAVEHSGEVVVWWEQHRGETIGWDAKGPEPFVVRATAEYVWRY